MIRSSNIEILRKSSNKFDDIFSKLPTLDNKEIRSQLILVKGLWKEFFKNIKVILDGNPKDKNFEFLEKNNMKLVDNIDKLVRLYYNS